MEAQRATVTLHVQVSHVAGEVQPTTHVLEHWLLDQVDAHPVLGAISTEGDDGRVASLYHVVYAGHEVDMAEASPDLRGGQPHWGFAEDRANEAKAKVLDRMVEQQ
jgi:hypothetical protein